MNLPDPKWHFRFLDLAAHISKWSKDATQVGAVVIGENHTLLSKGYNGFPRGFDDDLTERHGKPAKYEFTVHAEMNAIYNAAFNGISLRGAAMYVYPFQICHECAKGIIQSGIKKVFVPQTESLPPHWAKSMNQAARFLSEAGVEYHAINIK